MKVALFYHSLYSDWNHGNAHFLRGIAAELLSRNIELAIYEPFDAWSLQHLITEQGEGVIEEFSRAYPNLRSVRYKFDEFDLAAALDGVDLVIAHEWNAPELIRSLGDLRGCSGDFRLLFHDTHHRSITAPAELASYDLSNYDGVLAYGDIVRQIYMARGWAKRAWTWHEAADMRTFFPMPEIKKRGDLVWIGNWGDDERTAELNAFLIEPVKDLGLDASVFGVRYPVEAEAKLIQAGIHYGGWLPNFKVPETFAQFRVTVHIPRAAYARVLHGIPTIRPFEALACGIPLISAPWKDTEGLFEPGEDFLIARDSEEMKRYLRAVLEDRDLAGRLARNGRNRVLRRHTCAHRVDELLAIYRELKEHPALMASNASAAD